MQDLLEPAEAAAIALAPGLTLFRRYLDDTAQRALASLSQLRCDGGETCRHQRLGKCQTPSPVLVSKTWRRRPLLAEAFSHPEGAAGHSASSGLPLVANCRSMSGGIIKQPGQLPTFKAERVLRMATAK
jgi:hypothetical protein